MRNLRLQTSDLRLQTSDFIFVKGYPKNIHLRSDDHTKRRGGIHIQPLQPFHKNPYLFYFCGCKYTNNIHTLQIFPQFFLVNRTPSLVSYGANIRKNNKIPDKAKKIKSNDNFFIPHFLLFHYLFMEQGDWFLFP